MEGWVDRVGWFDPFLEVSSPLSILRGSAVHFFVSPEWKYPVAKETKNNKLNIFLLKNSDVWHQFCYLFVYEGSESEGTHTPVQKVWGSCAPTPPEPPSAVAGVECHYEAAILSRHPGTCRTRADSLHTSRQISKHRVNSIISRYRPIRMWR